MELLVVIAIIVLLGLASALGWTTDSRDSADWTPSEDGRRARRLQPRRP
jgi:type II secretory pathway pseudopilin PulG